MSARNLGVSDGRTDRRRVDEKRCFQFACAAGKIMSEWAMKKGRSTAWKESGSSSLFSKMNPVKAWRIWGRGRPIRRNVLPTREREGKKEGGLCKMFWRNGLQLLNPETKESEGKERTRLPPSSPRSISHDSQTLENLIELSTRNIAVVEGGVGAIHTYPDFQSDMPVDYIWS